MSLDWLPGLDLNTGTFTLPLWAVGIAAALFVALIVISIMRAGISEFGSLIFRVAIIVLVVAFGWTYLTRMSEQDRADERRALDRRAAELVGRALAPGSSIACLEAINSDSVEGACERAVFASPESVAAATAYLAARISLLSDAHDYITRRDQGYESSVAGQRRTIASDRYGLASQVLAARDGCTADACDAFALVYDDKKLRANLKDRLFDVTIARYAVNWPMRTRPLASSGPSGGATGLSAGPNVSFPSSASIPPASSMTAEPPAPPPLASPPPAQAAAPAATPPLPTNSAPASAPRRPAPAAKQPSPAPLSLNPSKQ